MGTKTPAKKKPATKVKPRAKLSKPASKTKHAPVVAVEKPSSLAVSPLAAKPKESVKEREERERRRQVLHQMLMRKRQEILKEIEGSLGQSLSEDKQRRLESARDVGDQALMDLDRELGISLMEMRNRRRQAIDDALTRLTEGTYGICAECGVEITERRLDAVPFAKLCVECQSKEELLERIEREEDRD
jgi:DnaK suppressor protein